MRKHADSWIYFCVINFLPSSALVSGITRAREMNFSHKSPMWPCTTTKKNITQTEVQLICGVSVVPDLVGIFDSKKTAKNHNSLGSKVNHMPVRPGLLSRGFLSGPAPQHPRPRQGLLPSCVVGGRRGCYIREGGSSRRPSQV